MPSHAVNNGLLVESIPEDLRDLNFVEEILIQLVRPIQVSYYVFFRFL
jgi:hypothetical protein